MPSLFENLFGSSDKLSNVPLYNKPQMQNINEIVQQAAAMRRNPQSAYNLSQGRLQDLLSGGGQAYNAFAAPYMRQFQEQTLPGIAERFAGAGGRGGALSSSGFGQALGTAGAGLQERLASLAANLQQDAMNRAMQDYYNTQGLAMTRTFQPTYQPGTTGLFGNILSGIGGGIGTGAGLFGSNYLASLLGLSGMGSAPRMYGF